MGLPPSGSTIGNNALRIRNKFFAASTKMFLRATRYIWPCDAPFLAAYGKRLTFARMVPRARIAPYRLVAYPKSACRLKVCSSERRDGTSLWRSRARLDGRGCVLPFVLAQSLNQIQFAQKGVVGVGIAFAIGSEHRIDPTNPRGVGWPDFLKQLAAATGQVHAHHIDRITVHRSYQR